MLSRLFPSADGCQCDPTFDGDRLDVDADDCSGSGQLRSEADCRATVVSALEERDATVVSTRSAGLERAYEGEAVALLVAAGRFADAVSFHDVELAARARRDPAGAARVATGRGNPEARIAAETGLATFAGADCEAILRPETGPTLARTRVAADPPPKATLRNRYDVETGGTVRIYDDSGLGTYHLTPAEHRLDADSTRILAAAYDRLVRGVVDGGERAPSRAVRSVATSGAPVERIVDVLRKHTHGLGVLGDLFADERVTDVFATAPVTDNRLRCRRDGEMLRTNVRLTEDGAAALASRFRRTSGRAFSRASPTLAATVDIGGRRIRVAGVTEPVSDGLGFTFRAHDGTSFRLSELVAGGTIPPDAAGLLSVAVESGAAILLAGPRGAGKTTTLGALLWELRPETRTVVIEDTPELPIEELQGADRDVQPLRVETDDGASISPTEALRTALRLGDGALVVGEVRGEEARVLYEAMRVGAADGAVLGTIHGEGAETVRERVVTDLGVPETAFADTDLVATLTTHESSSGRQRRLAGIEAVHRLDDGVGFRTVHDGDTARFDGQLLDSIDSSRPRGAVRDRIERRAETLSEDGCRY